MDAIDHGRLDANGAPSREEEVLEAEILVNTGNEGEVGEEPNEETQSKATRASTTQPIAAAVSGQRNGKSDPCLPGITEWRNLPGPSTADRCREHKNIILTAQPKHFQ